MNSFQHLVILSLLGLLGLSVLTAEPEPRGRGRGATTVGEVRNKKLLSVFNIVTFNNDPCNGNNNKNGTCYTAQECENKGGVSSGSCAQSYGVCCTTSIGCGGRSSENCTYFEVSNPSVGNCRATICPCNNNICQLRLDFNSFVITGPSTSSLSIGKATNGALLLGGAKEVTQATQCLTDTFSVSSSGFSPSSICGTNTGEHMYVDSDRGCNDLDFNIGQVGVGAGIAANREFNIKVTQIGCNHPNKAPQGCTQWHFGTAATGVVKSFNYDGGAHLANQDQNICVRREAGNCRICWAAVSTGTDFSVSGKTTVMAFTNMIGSCCGYGTDGMMTQGFDCVQFPGIVQKGTALNSALDGKGRFCGRMLGTIEGGTSATICQEGNAFNLRFLSDQFEFGVDGASMFEAMKIGVGFRLAYTQSTC